MSVKNCCVGPTRLSKLTCLGRCVHMTNLSVRTTWRSLVPPRELADSLGWAYQAAWQKPWLGTQDANGRSRAELLINTCAAVASTEVGSLFVLIFFFSIFVHERAGFHATGWVKRLISESVSRLALTRKLRHAKISLTLLDFDVDLQSGVLKTCTVKCVARQYSSLIVVFTTA